MLLAVVQEGTATKADLETFKVAGKSGTARRTSLNTGYKAGNYTATFVGLFPAEDPQYVVLVKLDSPSGSRYAGGDIAAPVTRIVLRAALAARDAALDREGLAAAAPRAVASVSDSVGGDTADREVASPALEPVPVSQTLTLPLKPKAKPQAAESRIVPNVDGLSLRAAVAALHSRGFQVRIVNGPSMTTLPAAGTVAAPGSIVQLGYSRE